eukprot:1156056-Pelagomonas_calceolata.AAC.13
MYPLQTCCALWRLMIADCMWLPSLIVLVSLQLMSAVEGMASNQVHTSYREAPNDDLAHAEFNVGTQAAFTSAPLVQGDSFLNVPVAYSTMSIYANIPGVT